MYSLSEDVEVFLILSIADERKCVGTDQIHNDLAGAHNTVH